MENIKFIVLLLLFTNTAISSTLPVNCNKDKSENPISLNYSVTEVYDNNNLFIQGMIYDAGNIYVSTGLYGQSSLNKINLKTGEIINFLKLKNEFFGEGLTIFNGQLIQLTWKSGKVLRYDKNNMKFINTQNINSEGWGLTSNDDHLITSDGSEFLYFRDPKTLKVMSKLKVHYMGRRLRNLNELEWVDNCILANIWQTNIIAIINPYSGNTLATIDLTKIAKKENTSDPESMPNGIALINNLSEILITGKYWKNVYQLKLK